ncbi:unnamed protein product [Pleuronectes platessa]|uniref:Uncharacterized protein n=1 Tax=Pleuronectes platessa TaxID=8262 RepID=A0A9N7UL71_PLEPL|nr:unnamed protein product [Pleuronectes platessa]
MGQLRKAFIELVKANKGLDASNYRQDMLKKRLTRDFPQLVFHIPTKRNVISPSWCFTSPPSATSASWFLQRLCQQIDSWTCYLIHQVGKPHCLVS